MRIRFGLAFVSTAMAMLFFGLTPPTFAQNQVGSNARAAILQKIDEGTRTTLRGNIRPEATPANDRGALADDTPMPHLLLQLQRSGAQEQALRQYIDDLQNPNSPNYHKWLTAQEFGEQFGVAKQDLDTVTEWLASHGMQVNLIYPNAMLIDFSASVRQVREAFRTEIHAFEVSGVRHMANASDPQIPAALAPVVAGVISLHDFMPHAMRKMRPAYTLGGSQYQAVVPGDLATIYNINPLFQAGTAGQGQTVVVLEDTDVYSTQDWTTFRSTFGLSAYSSGSFTQVHPAPPSGPNNCSDPGVNADDIEAILDAEYASATAPGATIELASCADTNNFGVFVALQNLLNESSKPPAVVSISYGQCEAVNGTGANAAYNYLFQQAAAEGVSVFVSSGDEGAASCDAGANSASHGIGVSGIASTPYDVAVGGTDFGDSYAGTNSSYWNSTNTSTYESAKSYVPEIPWNDSCAGVLLASVLGNSTTYGANGFCNGSTARSDGLLTTAAGSGGPSGCASGSATTGGVVSGSCAGYPKPSWQAVAGNPNDGVRDIPDVSLFAANGVWGHYYVFCDSNTANGGTPCKGAPSGWSGAGGTSFSAPIMAGIQALINQKTGSAQGNPNPVYYSLSAAEYGGGGDGSCNSTLGNAAVSTCVFYDVTQGDIDVNCTGTQDCYAPSGANGVLSTSDGAYKPAYGTTTGWDFATGIGSVNAANLANAWPSSGGSPSFGLSPSPSSLTITQGSGGTSTITIAPTNGFSGGVTLSASGLPAGVTASFATNPVTGSSVLTLTASGTAVTGTGTVTITGVSGSLTEGTTIALIVNASAQPNFALSASPSGVTITQGTLGTSTITITPSHGFTGGVALSASGLPSGVTASFGTNPATNSSVLTLTAAATAAYGTANITITGVSGSLTKQTTVSLTVKPAIPQNFALTASPSSLTVTHGTRGTSTITVTPSNGFAGNVMLTASGMPTGVTAAFRPNPTTTTSTLTLTVSRFTRTGTYTITVTGTSGNLTHTLTISLKVQS
ncbi:MAG TPA: protease pro-enzyme activation domain-containing protein [Candidatus Acidoferrales bacterium]|nr:protease pro-enzyme activation domain-containing protein [Candidatus Acidoferrales bacterium]